MSTEDSPVINGTPASVGLDHLLPHHLADLRASGLSDEQIVRSGVRSISDPATVQRLLSWKWGAHTLGPCLGFPYRDPSGAKTGYWRLKTVHPRGEVRNGKNRIVQ